MGRLEEATQFKVGDQVEGMLDGYWHPGKIVSIQDNQYKIKFYDGEEQLLTGNKVRRIEGTIGDLRVGDEVEFKFPTDWLEETETHVKHTYGIYEWAGQIDKIIGNAASKPTASARSCSAVRCMGICSLHKEKSPLGTSHLDDWLQRRG